MYLDESNILDKWTVYFGLGLHKKWKLIVICHIMYLKKSHGVDIRI